MQQAEKFAKSGGSIYPGFHDFYAEGGAGENLVSSYLKWFYRGIPLQRDGLLLLTAEE